MIRHRSRLPANGTRVILTVDRSKRDSAVQFATASKRLDDKAAEIAATLAKAGWRSPLEPLANGDIRAVWAGLSLMSKRAILDVVADVTVLPSKPTTRGFDPEDNGLRWTS